MTGRTYSRVLVVAYAFPPHAAIGAMRTLRVVRRLAEEGWDVTVLTAEPRTYRPGTPVDEALLDRVPGNIRIVRADTFRGVDALKGVVKKILRRWGPAGQQSSSGAPRSESRTPRGAAGRALNVIDAALAIPDHQSGWLIPAVARGLAASWRHRPDVLYSSAPPWTGHVVAGVLATSLRCRWVADFRDPWSRAPWRGDRFPFAMNAAGALERAVVRHADRILFVAHGNRDDFAAHYGPAVASKFQVIPNGCDPAEFEQLKRPSVSGDGPFVLLHAGSIYAGRTPVPLLKAIADMVRRGAIDPSRFRLRFLGAVGLESVDLTGMCREIGLEQIVEFVPRVAREQSLRAMVSASALLLLQPGHTVSVPGKLYEYLAAGRPILAIAEEGEIAELVRSSGIGISVPPDSEAAIESALESIIRKSRADVEPPPRELFDGTVGAAQVAAVLQAVVGRSDSPASVATVEVEPRSRVPMREKQG